MKLSQTWLKSNKNSQLGSNIAYRSQSHLKRRPINTRLNTISVFQPRKNRKKSVQLSSLKQSYRTENNSFTANTSNCHSSSLQNLHKSFSINNMTSKKKHSTVMKTLMRNKLKEIDEKFDINLDEYKKCLTLNCEQAAVRLFKHSIQAYFKS